MFYGSRMVTAPETAPRAQYDSTRHLLAEFEIVGLPQTINSIGRKHWAVKTKESKRWKVLVYTQCVIKRIAGLSLEKCRLELIRHSSKEPDFDGLVSSFKHIIDGLVYAKVMIDDKPSVIGSPEFKWVKVPHRHGKITIRVFT